MGILNYIKQKPDHQKKIISLVFALVLTFFIVGLWFSFDQNTSDADQVNNEPKKLSSFSPLQVIKDQFAKAFLDTKENLDLNNNEEGGQIIVEVLDETLDEPIELELASSTEISTTTENSN